MSLHDDLVDAVATLLGCTSAAEAVRSWRSIVGRLERVRDRLRSYKPDRRRNPGVDSAADWAWRSLHSAEASDRWPSVRTSAIVREIKALAGAAVPTWTESPGRIPHRQKSPRPGPSASRA